MRASVIVPTKNGAGRLPDLFAALAEQTVGPDAFEVVLVDDGSTDDTAAVAEAHGARVVRSPQSLGPGAASNLGVAHANAEAIAFTDDDTIPAPDWIERGLAALDASPSGLVGGHIELLLAEHPTVPALVDYGRGYLDQEGYVADGFAATANLWARRAVLQELEGFNAGAAWQTHDRDFGERARAAGLTIVYAADTVVAHPTRDRARDLAKVAYRLGLGAAWLRRGSFGAQTEHARMAPAELLDPVALDLGPRSPAGPRPCADHRRATAATRGAVRLPAAADRLRLAAGLVARGARQPLIHSPLDHRLLSLQGRGLTMVA